MVFDCAAVYHGTSLNDQLLQGLDLTNSLVGVLLRFRESPVALMADIEAMFHQVRITPNDYDALRYLWWPNNDLNVKPDEYHMLVYLFGATSSPSCANFALRKTADDCLTKWVSNSAVVIESIPESERAGGVKDLNFSQPTIQRALEKHWDVVTDEITFKVTIKEKPPTRRGLLSIVSSIYDPLGLVAPFVLPAKILLQELCRDNLSWDD